MNETLPNVTAQTTAIAEEAVELAPEGFDLLEIHGDFDFEEAAGVDGDVVIAGRRVPLDIGWDALDRFQEMRKAFQEAGQPLWSKATVVVTNTGQVTLQLQYDD
jgi:putative intracellular protease/amidase